MEPESIVLPLDDPPIPKRHGAQGKAHSILICNIIDTIEKVKGLIFKRSLSKGPFSFSFVLLSKRSDLVMSLSLARRIGYDI